MKSMETLKQQEHDYELMLKMLKDLKARDAKIRELLNRLFEGLKMENDYAVSDAESDIKKALLLLEGLT